MAEFHRKIELQSPDDLQYLISNVRRDALEKIDRDLPPIEGEDRMRRRVEDLVQEVRYAIFPSHGPNADIRSDHPAIFFPISHSENARVLTSKCTFSTSHKYSSPLQQTSR